MLEARLNLRLEDGDKGRFNVAVVEAALGPRLRCWGIIKCFLQEAAKRSKCDNGLTRDLLRDIGPSLLIGLMGGELGSESGLQNGMRRNWGSGPWMRSFWGSGIGGVR